MMDGVDMIDGVDVMHSMDSVASVDSVVPEANWNTPAFAVVMFQGKLGRSVTTERWHYVEWDEGRAGSMLLDHRTDPLELKNLVNESGYTDRIKEMKELLKRLPAKVDRSGS